jgi:sulfate permease, SulP family
VVAGVIVGVVALPLAMAFAIASGAKPEQGLYTAIVAGLLTSMFGGSRVQIGGPTGAFIVILAGITAKYGIAGLQVATLMAGFILMLMGLLRFGAVIKFIPDPVIVGFTTGIGVIIFVSQWKDFFGLKLTNSSEHFLEKITTALSIGSVLVLVFSPKIVPRIPGPLLVLVFATLIQSVFKIPSIQTVGSAFGGIPQSLPTFQLPTMTLTDASKLIGPAFTIALLGAIESLLCAVVADNMSGTKHDSNQELIGQGISNSVAPLFGGFAATGAIARTATNIRNGATSPVAGIVHSITLISIILVCAPLASDVPLCALAAILFVVAFNLSELPRFTKLVRTAPKSDVVILLVTFLLTVFADLVVAVNAGVLLAALLFMKRMASAVEITDQTSKFVERSDSALDLRKDIVVLSIDGPLFFGAVSKLEHALDHIDATASTIILRMGNVPFVDATGIASLQNLVDSSRQRKARVILCEIRPNVKLKLDRAGLIKSVGEENVFPAMDDAVEKSR